MVMVKIIFIMEIHILDNIFMEPHRAMVNIFGQTETFFLVILRMVKNQVKDFGKSQLIQNQINLKEPITMT